MQQLPARQTPSKRERRAIALVTLLFIAASAVLHVTLGSTFRSSLLHPEVAQSAGPITISALETPTPRPTPRQTPRPRTPKQAATSRPLAKSTAPTRKGSRPVTKVNAPHTTATPDGSGENNIGPTSPPEPQSPQITPAPIDDREIIVSARFINRVVPEYPQIAIDQRQEGTVIVLLTVGPNGVSDVRVEASSGSLSLDQAAVRAAKQSTYSIPEVNGEPATETYRVIYTFSLDSGVM